MSVKGFKLNDGSVVKYDYPSLDNIATDTTLSLNGVAADANAVGDKFNEADGKINRIGTILSSECMSNWSTISVETGGTWHILDTITLPAGIWLIIYGARISGGGTNFTSGNWCVDFNSNDTGTSHSSTRMSKQCLLSGYPEKNLEGSSIFSSNGKTYYLYGMQTSGRTCNVLPYMRAIRIK